MENYEAYTMEPEYRKRARLGDGQTLVPVDQGGPWPHQYDTSSNRQFFASSQQADIPGQFDRTGQYAEAQEGNQRYLSEDSFRIQTLMGQIGTLSQQLQQEQREKKYYKLKTLEFYLRLCIYEPGMPAEHRRRAEALLVTDYSTPPRFTPIPSVTIPSDSRPSALLPSAEHYVSHPFAPSPSAATTSVPHPSIPHSSIPHSSIPHSSIPHSSIPHSSIPHPSIPHSSIPHSYIHHSYIPHSSIPHSSIPHPSIPRPSTNRPSAPPPSVDRSSAPRPSAPAPPATPLSAHRSSAPHPSAPRQGAVLSSTPSSYTPRSAFPVTASALHIDLTIDDTPPSSPTSQKRKWASEQERQAGDHLRKNILTKKFEWMEPKDRPNFKNRNPYKPLGIDLTEHEEYPTQAPHYDHDLGQASQEPPLAPSQAPAHLPARAKLPNPKKNKPSGPGARRLDKDKLGGNTKTQSMSEARERMKAKKEQIAREQNATMAEKPWEQEAEYYEAMAAEMEAGLEQEEPEDIEMMAAEMEATLEQEEPEEL